MVLHSLTANTTVGSNTAFGAYTLTATTTGGDNTALGRAMDYADNSTGAANTAVGYNSLIIKYNCKYS